MSTDIAAAIYLCTFRYICGHNTAVFPISLAHCLLVKGRGLHSTAAPFESFSKPLKTLHSYKVDSKSSTLQRTVMIMNARDCYKTIAIVSFTGSYSIAKTSARHNRDPPDHPAQKWARLCFKPNYGTSGGFRMVISQVWNYTISWGNARPNRSEDVPSCLGRARCTVYGVSE